MFNMFNMNELWAAYLDDLEAHIRLVAHALTVDPSSVEDTFEHDLQAPPEGSMPATLAPRAHSLMARMEDLGRCIEDEMRSVSRRRHTNRTRTIPVFIDSRM